MSLGCLTRYKLAHSDEKKKTKETVYVRIKPHLFKWFANEATRKRLPMNALFEEMIKAAKGGKPYLRAKDEIIIDRKDITESP